MKHLKWVVKLVKIPTINDYRSGYFPRTFYYKKDAQKLVEEVAKKGGATTVEKEQP